MNNQLDIVNQYHYQNVIEFPILGPYIKLAYDWLKLLNERDRVLLREGFILKLRELLDRRSSADAVTAREVFDAMEFGAFSDTLIPAIVESLVLDGYVRKVNRYVELSPRGREKNNQIEERRRLEHQETLRRLGYQ